MAFQPHINDDVAVMLITVGDVEHQHGAPDGIVRRRVNIIRNLPINFRFAPSSVHSRLLHSFGMRGTEAFMRMS
jgi:hypothetical protein